MLQSRAAKHNFFTPMAMVYFRARKIRTYWCKKKSDMNYRLPTTQIQMPSSRGPDEPCLKVCALHCCDPALLCNFGAKRSNIKFLQLMFFLRSLTPKVSQRFLSLGKTYWKEIGDPSTLTTLWPLEPQRRAMSLFKGAKEANNRPKEDLLKAQFWGMSRICPHTGSGILTPKKPGVSRSTLLFAMKDTIRSVTRKIGLRKRFWIRPVFHQQSKGFCPQPSGKNFHRGGG